MSDLTLQIVIFRVLALLPIAACHGLAIAAATYLQGDRGPRFDGRLTASPFAHLDVVGSIALVALGLGWIRPVAINPAEMRSGRVGLVVAAAAGIVANLVLAVVLQMLRVPVLNLSTGSSMGIEVVAFLDVAAGLSLWFAVFNLIPLPPLTGGLVLRALVPGTTAWLARYAVILIIVILAFATSGLAQRTLAPIHAAVAGWLLR